jgi:hypothetical protein
MTIGAQQRKHAWLPVNVQAGSSSTTAGKLAAREWLLARVLDAPAGSPWHVEISLDACRDPDASLDANLPTLFRLEIHSEEWGVYFSHQGNASWIRVTDVPFAHGCDDFRLLRQVPPLKDIGILLRTLELQHGLRFDRNHADISTNIARAEPVVKSWVRRL